MRFVVKTPQNLSGQDLKNFLRYKVEGAQGFRFAVVGGRLVFLWPGPEAKKRFSQEELSRYTPRYAALVKKLKEIPPEVFNENLVLICELEDSVLLAHLSGIPDREKIFLIEKADLALALPVFFEEELPKPEEGQPWRLMVFGKREFCEQVEVLLAEKASFFEKAECIETGEEANPEEVFSEVISPPFKEVFRERILGVVGRFKGVLGQLGPKTRGGVSKVSKTHMVLLALVVLLVTGIFMRGHIVSFGKKTFSTLVHRIKLGKRVASKKELEVPEVKKVLEMRRKQRLKLFAERLRTVASMSEVRLWRYSSRDGKLTVVAKKELPFPPKFLLARSDGFLVYVLPLGIASAIPQEEGGPKESGPKVKAGFKLEAIYRKDGCRVAKFRAYSGGDELEDFLAQGLSSPELQVAGTGDTVFATYCSRQGGRVAGGAQHNAKSATKPVKNTKSKLVSVAK